MKNAVKVAAAASLAVVLAACSSKEPAPKYPAWVLNPIVEDGIASAQCVKASSSISTDRAQAIALARVDLAQQIGVNIKAMDKTFQEKVETNDQVVNGSTFSSVSKQLTQQSLQGARAIKVEYAKEDSELCVLVSLGAKSTKELFDNIVKESSRKMNPRDEAVLYQEFKAHKAQQEMEQAFSQ